MDVRTLMRRAAHHYSDFEAIVHNDTRPNLCRGMGAWGTTRQWPAGHGAKAR
jgi:hypothetical protein